MSKKPKRTLPDDSATTAGSRNKVPRLLEKEDEVEMKTSPVEEKLKKSIFRLFEDGNTIPFLSRYRKEMIGGLNPDALRHLHDEFELKKYCFLMLSKLSS